MAIEYVDSTQLDSDLTSVANAIRAKSGGSGQLAFPAGFVSEIGNISGGMAPPTTAVAQFEVSATFSTQPAKIVFNASTIQSKLTNSRTYPWSLLLWRNNKVSSTTYTYIANVLYTWGRITRTGGAVNQAQAQYTNSSAMTSGSQGNYDNVLSSGNVSSGVFTITLKNVGSDDLTGEWKGIFTVLPPWTDSYTGTKMTTAPTGFLSYQ